MEYVFDYSEVEKEQKKFEPIDDGDYEGVVESAKVETNAKGNKFINVKLRLGNKRVVFDRLNVESENGVAIDIAMKKFKSMVYFGIENPPAKFSTFEQMAGVLQDTPVLVYYKNKGKDDRGYDRFSLTYKKTANKKKAGTVKAGAVY
jgi:hypothetical protein